MRPPECCITPYVRLCHTVKSVKSSNVYSHTRWTLKRWHFASAHLVYTKVRWLKNQCHDVTFLDRIGGFMTSSYTLRRLYVWSLLVRILYAPLGTPQGPGTIAVNVTWIERGFNAGQTHSSIYPSIFYRLRAIARYWSEIATFSYPLAFNAPGCSHWNSVNFWSSEN